MLLLDSLGAENTLKLVETGYDGYWSTTELLTVVFGFSGFESLYPIT